MADVVQQLGDRWRAQRRRRELASALRAGRWTRDQARRLQRDFARRHWKVWLVAALSTAIALGVMSVLPISDGLQWFIVGATTAGLIAWTWSFIVLASGSALFMLGDLGEQWTKSELDRLPRRSWRTIYHVLFRTRGDVDAIAIGPGGLLVIETKWSGKGWTAPEQRRWIEAAVNQVEDSAHITELQLRSVIGPVVARRVVVLWGPTDMPEEVEELRSASVVPGPQLRTWLAALPDDQLSAAQVEQAWAFIEHHQAQRDDHDLEHNGPVLRSSGELLWNSVQYVVGAVAAVGALSLWTLPSWFAVQMAVTVATLVLTRWAAKREHVRRVATGALVAQCLALVWVAAVLIARA